MKSRLLCDHVLTLTSINSRRLTALKSKLLCHHVLTLTSPLSLTLSSESAHGYSSETETRSYEKGEKLTTDPLRV